MHRRLSRPPHHHPTHSHTRTHAPATCLQGYHWYMIILYSVIGLLAVNIGLCVWATMAFKQQKFDYLWPLVVGGGSSGSNGHGVESLGDGAWGPVGAHGSRRWWA